jgi:hypothetical protein
MASRSLVSRCVTTTLRPYQEAAADQICKLLIARRLAYLAGEVRTGKTLTVLEVARRLGCHTVLLATKKKAITSIEADVAAMDLCGVVMVTNFEQLHKLANARFDLLIVDEAHGVGAYPKPSKRFRDLRAINAGALLLMSGTPSPESFSQLFHQFALSPFSPWSRYRTFYAWAKVGYVHVCQRYVGTAMPVNDYSRANEALVLRDVEPLTVRMTQEDAGFSQPIVERIHLVAMRRRTYRMASRIMRTGVIGRPDCRSVLADTGSKVMSKLRQLWSGTVITEAHGSIVVDDSKARFIVRQWADRSKVAVLYTFDAERRMLDRVFAAAGITATDSPEEFNAGGRDVWFRGQVQASREGVNLSSADDLVFLGVDYAALSYLQGRDRASHLGRDRENRVHWLLAAGGMEIKILETVRAKEDFTVAHYRAERGRISTAIDAALRGPGVDGGATAAHERGRTAGSAAGASHAGGGVRGGEGRWRHGGAGAAIPTPATAGGRVSGAGGVAA